MKANDKSNTPRRSSATCASQRRPPRSALPLPSASYQCVCNRAAQHPIRHHVKRRAMHKLSLPRASPRRRPVCSPRQATNASAAGRPSRPCNTTWRAERGTGGAIARAQRSRARSSTLRWSAPAANGRQPSTRVLLRRDGTRCRAACAARTSSPRRGRSSTSWRGTEAGRPTPWARGAPWCRAPRPPRRSRRRARPSSRGQSGPAARRLRPPSCRPPRATEPAGARTSRRRSSC
mmetsp:Transcript_62007/g.192181  ORF Transcript_62007/g.192181 Transcript_62007/m.192181 type:complete len:234 (+) Transcript_62007:52-753(+)